VANDNHTPEVSACRQIAHATSWPPTGTQASIFSATSLTALPTTVDVRPQFAASQLVLSQHVCNRGCRRGCLIRCSTAESLLRDWLYEIFAWFLANGHLQSDVSARVCETSEVQPWSLAMIEKSQVAGAVGRQMALIFAIYSQIILVWRYHSPQYGPIENEIWLMKDRIASANKDAAQYFCPG
jgi:hypothetical protein